MTDYFATQRTNGACAPYNCAAASGAMGLAAATAGRITLTADEFRQRSGVSCAPGAHSPSGGLFISDVVRVFESYGEAIDYGISDTGIRRWTAADLTARLDRNRQGAVLLGDYDALPWKYRSSFTFRGDHSVWVHDYRPKAGDLCWHDPLRSAPIRIPASAAIAYWQKPTSPIRGFAGFVEIAVPLPDTSTEDDTVTITRNRWERWKAVNGNGVLRRNPVRSEAPFVRLADGTEVFTEAEATTPDGNVWRLTEYAGQPAWLLRAGPGVPPDHDFAPLVPGGDPDLDRLRGAVKDDSLDSNAAFNAGVDAAVAAAQTARR